MDYRFEDTVADVHIEYVYTESLGKVDKTELYLTYGDLKLRVLKGHREDSRWSDPEILSFDLKYLDEAMYIFKNVGIRHELEKCCKCEPHRLWQHGFCEEEIVGGEHESWCICYSKVPDKEWDGVGKQYVLSIEYYYGEHEECSGRDHKEMHVIFDKTGEVLEVRDYYKSMIDTDKLIGDFLKYCRKEGVV